MAPKRTCFISIKGKCNNSDGAGCIKASQLWRWNQTAQILENKENIWKSNNSWKIVQGKRDFASMVRIEQMSKEKTESDSTNPFDELEGGKYKTVTKFLKNPYGDGNEVLLQETVHLERKKYWKKRQKKDDYFTLETPSGAKILTAISKDSLEIKGNFGYITLENSLETNGDKGELVGAR